MVIIKKKKMTTPASENKAAIYVADLPITVTQAELHNFFESYGKISNIRLVKDKESRSERKPAAIIQFDKEESASKAVEEKGHSMFNDHHIRTMLYNRNFMNVVSNIVVKNVNTSVIPSQLQEYFAQFGQVQSVKISYESKEGAELSKGYGFVQFSSAEEAKKAVDAVAAKTSEVLNSPNLEAEHFVPRE